MNICAVLGRASSLLALTALLAGCGALADMTAVAGERGKAVLRSDQFQSVAATAKAVVGVGSFGTVVSSVNGGRTWSRQTLKDASLIAVTPCPDGSFAALDYYRKVWTADAAGKEWKAKTIATQSNPLALTCDPRGQLWVVGSQSTILSSPDAGVTWKETALGQDTILTTVQFVNESHGFITGEFGTLLATSDGGATWQPGPKLPNDFYPYAAHFVDTTTGWVSGLAGSILHTTDGGKSWIKQANVTGAPMYGLASVDGQMLAVGANGLVLKLAGDTWTPVPGVRPAPYLRSAVALGADRLLLAGGAGTIDAVSLGAITVVKK